MNYVRIHGDPFSDTVAASQLRGFLRFAGENGMRCALSLPGVVSREPGPDERVISVTDGVCNWTVATHLPPADVDLIMQTVRERIAATAPVVVFCGEDQGRDQDRLQLVGLEWPKAAAVLRAKTGDTSPQLLSRVQGELRWAGTESPPNALFESELSQWLDLPTQTTATTIVHVGSNAFDGGADLVVDAFSQNFAASGLRLRLVMACATESTLRMLRQRAGKAAHLIDIVATPFAPEHVIDAAAIVMPFRRFDGGRTLVMAMASGRAVCVSRFADNAAMIEATGAVHVIGGRNIIDDAEHGAFFAPDVTSITEAMTAAVSQSSNSSTGLRARTHVAAELIAERPASPPAPLARLGGQRPVVVLEGPIFESSSIAEVTIATAQALLQRGNVDVRLVPLAPFQHDLDWLRQRAPELEPFLTRNPGPANLWLSAGLPVRASRPNCRKWALRLTQEDEPLPIEISPHVTQDADYVIVDSELAYQSIVDAGRPVASMELVSSGVDAAICGAASSSDSVLLGQSISASALASDVKVTSGCESVALTIERLADEDQSSMSVTPRVRESFVLSSIVDDSAKRQPVSMHG